ncbi:nudC domain-containing protein 3 [Morone saxatilis]|uniref:nudC domain-containing protein 3 n=1 Tax=Morone saxatilis TaxID=34816 RepID=UPI0015E1CAC1|nr:nudC domain-containing protein 3 [Morone saxatilis]
MASPLEMTEMYDNALLGILQHVGNIQDFLRVYFGFLYRKTDFYRLLSSPNEKMGFPPGVAEKMVFQTFKLFEKMADHDRERQLSELQKREESRSVPPAVQELEIAAEPPEGAEEKSSNPPPPTYHEYLSDSGCVSRLCPAGRPQVRVSLQPSSMKVCVLGAEETTLMEGEFTHKINTENSLWSLEPGSCVVLSLSKTSEVWWNAVLKGEKEIDINQINRERSMATVDEEEHAVLDRLTFDYHQKLQGKPQSHEMKVHDMLKKGWDAEGSPFRGQQFDPSMFDIPPSAVQF